MQTAKVLQPIPRLPAWTVITALLEFYGHKNQVIALLQRLHRASWKYLQSHHKAMLFSVLKEHRFAPYNSLPQFLTAHDIHQIDRCDLDQKDKTKDMICRVWN